ILSKYIVKSVKVFREQVRKTQSSNKAGSPVDKYVPMKKEPTLIAFSSQEPNQKLINKKSNIAEENNMSIEAQGIRTFNVLDDTLDFSNPSLYRYRVEMEIYDDTKKYFQDKIFQLRAFLTVLNDYRSSIENSTVQSKGKRNFNSKTRRVGGFNRKMDSLTQDFADLMRNKYDTSLKEMLATFMNMYKLFLPKEAINQSQEQRITNFFGLASNPSSTNPTALLALIELVQGMTDKLISVVPDSSVASSPSSFPSQSIKKDSRATKNTIYVNNVFANIIDLTKFSSGGYDYLSKNIPSSFSSARLNVGLRSVPGAEFKGRIKQETLKYFTKETPDLTNGMVGGTPPVKYTSEDQVLNSSYTFFSPAVIRTHKGNYAIRSDTYNDFSLCGQIQREIVSTKLNSMSNPYSPLSATEGGTVDAAIDSENYLLKNYNTRLERKKVMTLQQRKNLGLRLPSESEPVPNNQDAVISTERRIELNAASDLLKLLTSRQSSIDPASSGHSFKTPLGKGDDFSNFYNLNNPKNYLNTVQTSQATRLPNQIKSLFMTVTGNLKDVKNRPFGSKNIFSNPDEAGASFLRYRLLVSVEYLTGFGKSGTNFSESVMQKPVWAPLDAGSFSALSGRKLLCRLKKFEISNWGITRPKQMDMGIYDEYFVLVPDTPVTSPQDSINPQDVVFDTLQNPPTPAPGFRELEKDLAPLASFGRTTKPGKKYRPNSGKIRNIVSKIGTLTEKISSNLVSDAFNANQSLVYSDGRRKLKASEKVAKDKESPISKRISKMRGDRINPSIKPSKGKEATRTSNASEFSILDTAGDLPQLRQQLIQIRASGNFIAQKNNNSQKRIEQLTEAKLDGERKINNLKQKEQIDKEMTRVDRMDNIIISSKKQIEKEKKNMLKLKKEEKRVEQQIYQETKRIQQKIQSLPDQGSQAGKTKDPFNSTKNLQSSFVEDLNKIASEQAMTSKTQIDRINKYKGYLAEGDAKELDGLVKELQEQMIEKAHVSYDAGKSDSTSYGVEKAKESYTYTSAVSDVSDVVSVLDAAGTSAGYVREAAQDLAQKIIGKAKMDNQTKALAVESVVNEAYKLKGKKGR
ncbi:MAG: hypothetical protein NWE80_01530, partial [Candidatus Bathyarchaeota archaeon]|nr:hypothetical protein [Candidatus Bathyarchaeota archaeon]